MAKKPVPPDPPRCQHIRDSGRRCGSPALRNQAFCYYHLRLHDERALYKDPCYLVPGIESGESIQLTTFRIMRALAAGQIDTRTATTLFYGLQVAAGTRKHLDRPLEYQVSTDLTPAMQHQDLFGSSAVLGSANAPVRAEVQAKPVEVARPERQEINHVSAGTLTCATPEPCSADALVRAEDSGTDTDISNDNPPLPPEILNLRLPNGQLFYQPPERIHLTPEDLDRIRDKINDPALDGTPEQNENLDLLQRWTQQKLLKPRTAEEILERYHRAVEEDKKREALWSSILSPTG